MPSGATRPASRRAIFYRGILYWNGDYYPQDRDKAVTFFERAGQLGEADGWFWAGRYYSWKYWGALAHHQPASSYGEEAAYCYAKAHYMGNKEAWEELIGDSLGTARRPISGYGGRKKRAPRRRPRGEPGSAINGGTRAAGWCRSAPGRIGQARASSR